VPLAWSWRLSEATTDQRNHWELVGDRACVHWPEVDEDISIEGMLHGTPAPRPVAVLCVNRGLSLKNIPSDGREFPQLPSLNTPDNMPDKLYSSQNEGKMPALNDPVQVCN